MTDTEKLKLIIAYVRRRYKQESDVWADADMKGEVINAAKASIREEILWEIILFINKLDIKEARK